MGKRVARLTMLTAPAVLVVCTSAGAQEAQVSRVVFQVGSRLVALIVEKRADITVGVLAAATYDATKGALSEILSPQHPKKPELPVIPGGTMSCNVNGTSSISCSGVGSITFNWNNPTSTSQPPGCSLYTSVLASTCRSRIITQKAIPITIVPPGQHTLTEWAQALETKSSPETVRGILPTRDWYRFDGDK